MSARWLVLVWAVAGCGAAQHPGGGPLEPVTAHSLYPMEAGRAWSYDATARDGENVLAVVRVVSEQGAVSEVSAGQDSQLYERRPDGIYRQTRGGYLLRDPIEPGKSWPTGGEQTATVREVGLAVDTPAGHFERCVEIHEAGAASGMEVLTVYCPGVGPVRVLASIEVRGQRLEERAVLRGVAPEPAP